MKESHKILYAKNHNGNDNDGNQANHNNQANHDNKNNRDNEDNCNTRNNRDNRDKRNIFNHTFVFFLNGLLLSIESRTFIIFSCCFYRYSYVHRCIYKILL